MVLGFSESDIFIFCINRYDESCTGEIDYNDFVEKVMESDFKAVHVSVKKNLENMVSCAFPGDDKPSGEMAETVEDLKEDESDADDDEWESVMRDEIKKLYDLVDHDKSGYIDRLELEILLQQLGRTVSPEDIEKGFQRLDMDGSGLIDFNEFYTWYTSSLVQCNPPLG